MLVWWMPRRHWPRRHVLDPKIAALMRHAEREAVDLPAGGGARQVMLIGAPDFPQRVAIAFHPVPGIAVGRTVAVSASRTT